MTWQEKARQFHLANPGVYELLVGYARQVREAGHLRTSMGLLWNRLRWEEMVKVDDPASAFKLNENYKSFYARLIMEQEPDLDGLFETRALRS